MIDTIVGSKLKSFSVQKKTTAAKKGAATKAKAKSAAEPTSTSAPAKDLLDAEGDSATDSGPLKLPIPSATTVSSPTTVPPTTPDRQPSQSAPSTTPDRQPSQPASPQNTERQNSLANVLNKTFSTNGEQDVSAAMQRIRPRPVKQRTLPNGDDDSLFLSNRRGWRRPSTPEVDNSPPITGTAGLDVQTTPTSGPRAATPAVSEGIESDWEETAQREAIQRKRKERQALDLGRHLTPTLEEQDEEDEQEFIKQAFTSSKKRPAGESHDEEESGEDEEDTIGTRSNPPNSKGKQRHRTASLHSDGDKDDDHYGNRPETVYEYKAGPLPEAAKEAAFALHQTYQQQMQDLANEYEKPVKHFFQLVGQAPIKTRRLNTWNAFQAWYGVHGDQRPKDSKIFLWLTENTNLTCLVLSPTSRMDKVCAHEIQ